MTRVEGGVDESSQEAMSLERRKGVFIGQITCANLE